MIITQTSKVQELMKQDWQIVPVPLGAFPGYPPPLPIDKATMQSSDGRHWFVDSTGKVSEDSLYQLWINRL